jgi:hypothetical protein
MPEKTEMSGGMDFIDLFSSGEKTKILCVISSMAAGGLVGGVAVGEATKNRYTIALGAALGTILGYQFGYQRCGAASTRGSFNNHFNRIAKLDNKMPKSIVDEYEKHTISKFGLTPEQARYVTKAAVVNLKHGVCASHPSTDTSVIHQKHAVTLLLHRGGQMAG